MLSSFQRGPGAAERLVLAARALEITRQDAAEAIKMPPFDAALRPYNRAADVTEDSDNLT
jgi:hypothetical protein